MGTTPLPREAVDLLIKLGFIEKKNDRYVQCNPIITTGDEVRSLAITNFHIENLALASKAIETVRAAITGISPVSLQAYQMMVSNW